MPRIGNFSVPYISVVIPTYGEKGVGLTEACLKSMREAHPGVNIQKFVVDDASGPEVAQKLFEVCNKEGATLLVSDQNGGFAKSCNIGMSMSDGISVVLVNNDITFDKSCPALLIMSDTIRNMGAGVVGCRLLYPDNTIQHAGVFFSPAPRGPNDEPPPIPGYFDHALRFQPRNHMDAVSFRRSLVTGALFGISRATIAAIGFLDDRFGMAAEDIDYCLSTLNAGRDVLYNGYAFAYHGEGQTRGRTLEEKLKMNPKAWDREQEGLVKLFDKWVGTDWSQFSMGQG